MLEKVINNIDSKDAWKLGLEEEFRELKEHEKPCKGLKVFIFEDVSLDRANQGGVVFVAKNKSHIERILKEMTLELTEENWNNVTVYCLAEEANPEMFIFPRIIC